MGLAAIEDPTQVPTELKFESFYILVS